MFFCPHPRHSLAQFHENDQFGLLQHILEHQTQIQTDQEKMMADYAALQAVANDFTTAVDTARAAFEALTARVNSSTDQATIDALTAQLNQAKQSLADAVAAASPPAA